MKFYEFLSPERLPVPTPKMLLTKWEDAILEHLPESSREWTSIRQKSRQHCQIL